MQADIAKLELYTGGLTGDYKHDDAANAAVLTAAGARTTGSAAETALKNLAKKALYSTTISDNADSNVAYYRNKIDNYLNLIREFEI
jgi:hypothetical protein